MVRRISVSLIIRDNLCFFQLKMVGHQNPVNSAAAKFAVKLVLRGNSGLGLPERLPTVSEQAVGSSQDLVDRGAGEIIKIPGQYCRFGKMLA